MIVIMGKIGPINAIFSPDMSKHFAKNETEIESYKF